MNNKKYQEMYRAVEALLDDTVLSLRTQVKEVLFNDSQIDEAIWELARDPELCRGAFGDEFAQNLLLLNSVAESVSLLDDLTHFSSEAERTKKKKKKKKKREQFERTSRTEFSQSEDLNKSRETRGWRVKKQFKCHENPQRTSRHSRNG